MRTLAPRLTALLIVAGVGLLLACTRAVTPPPAPEATCGLSADSLSFGTVRVGNSADRAFTIKNTGSGILAGVVGSTREEFAILGPLSYALDAGESLSFTVRFTPRSIGFKTATVATGLPACPRVLASGTAETLPGPICELSATTLDFGSVPLGSSADRSFTILNAGDSTLSGSIAQPSCQDFAVMGTLGYALAPAESASFTVRFRPTASGVQHCSLSTGSTSCPGVSLNGSSPDPACEVSPAALVFDTVAVGTSAELPFTITNTGGGRLAGTVTACGGDFTIVGPASYDLGHADTARFTVRFAPSRVGSKQCTIHTGSVLCSDVAASGIAGSGIRTGDILVADGITGLIIVNPTTGEQRSLAPGYFNDVVTNTRGEIFALEGAQVDRIDPSTGAKSTVVYDGVTLSYGRILDQAPGGMLYVMTDSRLARVDPATGAITVIASGLNADCFAVMDDQTGYIQIGGAFSFTYRIDLVSGAMTQVESVGFKYPRGLARDEAGDLWVVAQDHGLYRIHPTTGAVELVSGGFQAPLGVATDLNGNILVVDYEHQDMSCDPPGGPVTCAGSVYRVDPGTKAKTQVTQNGFFYYPYAVDVFRGPGVTQQVREARARTISGPSRRVPVRSWGVPKR